ncbi:GntR family transcriptional regulator [Telmatobacter sp. DSM 110680]|uniref:GntR family transcriptional regulator n=1 Tax=Telmatobacter sp. DSM 110680 TaxID=3036704 RepID=A0AAU7DEZ2_9BACT
MKKSHRVASKLGPPPESDPAARLSKHRRVFDHLLASIQSGELKPGDRLPSEAELGKFFDASRITVAKAVHDLQRMGLVSRRPGSGTHVLAEDRPTGRTFGLLIPELGITEIFEPICHGMMRTHFARPDSLLWGNSAVSVQDSVQAAEQMVQAFISQRVAGVFFAPLELTDEKDAANRRIARMLDRAQIPFVLLDRCYLPYPERSPHDLVGVDNRRAGHMATAHLLECGAHRVVFLGEEFAANTVDARITGFYEALRTHAVRPDWELVWRGSPQDEAFIRRMLEAARPDAVVCANDLTAARLMQVLLAFGISIPEDIKIVGMDDVRYASLLPVPLTTIHQDCAGIGAVAMATMRERLEHPELPIRDVLVPVRLVVRRSCGTQHLKSTRSEANVSATE